MSHRDSLRMETRLDPYTLVTHDRAPRPGEAYRDGYEREIAAAAADFAAMRREQAVAAATEQQVNAA